MTFPTAITAGQKTKLRGSGTGASWWGDVYATLCPNTTIFAARVNQATFDTSFAQITYDGVTTGAYTDIVVDMVVLIAHTNDRRAAFFRGRVRATPTASILYINETSAPIADNDWIWVINDYQIQEKLARDTGTVYYKDYDKTFAQLPPVVYGLKSAYIGFVSGSPSGYTVPFSITAYAATSGATISSYQWTVPSGATLTAGSATTASVTYRFDAGFENWVRLTVTDSGGRTITRKTFVAAHDRSSNPPDIGFDQVRISGDWNSGYNATLTGFTGIDTTLDQTLFVLWVEEAYNGTVENIIDNVVFVGRWRRETNVGRSDDTYSYVTDAPIELEGPAAQLARLTGAQLALRNSAAPTVWDEITNLTVWRGIVHLLAEHSTFLSLHDLSFFAVDNTFKAQQASVQGSNLLAAVNDLAESINASIEFAPAGASRVMRDARYLTTAERSALTTVLDYTTEDLMNIDLARDHFAPFGRAEGSGGTFDSAANTVTPFLSLAPGVAQESGEQTTTLSRQILAADVANGTAQSELNTRVGHHLAAVNGEAEIAVDHLDGYGFPVPSKAAWYTFTLDSTTNVRGLSYTTSTRWLLSRISFAYDNEAGTRTVQAGYTQETTGTAGQTVLYPTPAEADFPIPQIPPFDAFPNLPEDPAIYLDEGYSLPYAGDPFSQIAEQTLSKDGNVALFWDSDQVWATRELIKSSNPASIEVTPGDGTYTIVAAMMDFWRAGGATVLTTKAGQSSVWRCDNVFAGDPAWTQGDVLEGAYTALRRTDVKDTIAIFSSNNSETTTAQVHVTFDSGGDSYSIEAGDRFGLTGSLYANGNPGNSCGYEGGDPAEAQIKITFPSTVKVTAVYMDRMSNNSASSDGILWRCKLYDSGNTLLSTPLEAEQYDEVAGQWYTQSATGLSVTGVKYVTFHVSSGNTPPQPNNIRSYMDNCKVTYETTTTTEGVVATSINRGDTWSAVQSSGTFSEAEGGFDTQHVGDYSYAAADAQVMEATSKGGAYASEGSALTATYPLLIVIPWYTLGSTTAGNTGANPDYIVATPAQVGGESVWKDNSSGTRTAITPTVSGNDGLAVSANCAMMWKGTKIAMLLSFGGTIRLVTSTDTGSNWTDRGAMGANAKYIRGRYKSTTGNQLFWVDSANIKYSPDFGATIRTRATPATTLLGVEVYG